MLNTSQVPRLQTTLGAPAHPSERRVNCPALNAFTFPAIVRFARHDNELTLMKFLYLIPLIQRLL